MLNGFVSYEATDKDGNIKIRVSSVRVNDRKQAERAWRRWNTEGFFDETEDEIIFVPPSRIISAVFEKG